MIRVLFVDDEINILEGLQRMLRPMRSEWTTDFASSAGDALDKLSAARFDVIVSDMRMPGMDGAQLLALVCQAYPHMVRIALSGHTDHHFIVRAAASAHQFLAKPCDPAILKDTIAQTCSMRDRVESESLRERICSTRSAPSQGRAYHSLITELSSGVASTERTAQIIAGDIGMCAKTLQLVHSAFFGTPRTGIGPLEAVSMLGVDTLRSLAVGGDAFREMSTAEAANARCDLWSVSQLTARICGSIGETERLPRPVTEAAQVAGLLHRIGLLAASGSSEAIGSPDDEAAAGAYLLSLWGFPREIIDAVAWRCRPSDAPDSRSIALALVHAASVLARELVACPNTPAETVDGAFLSSMGLLDRIPDWRRAAALSAPRGAAQ